MKKYLSIFASALMGALLLSSCANEDNGMGNARLNLTIDINDEVAVISRAENASPADNCVIYIYSSKGLIRKYNRVSDVPAEMWLASGSYRVETWAGDSTAASWTDKYFRGNADFTLTAGATKQVNVKCKIANTVVVVNFPENVDEFLKDYSMIVTGEDDHSLTYDATTADKKGYFMFPADGSGVINWSIVGYQLDGTPFKQSGKIENVKRTTEYQLNITKQDESFDLGGAMFGIEVNEEPLETINDKFTLTEAPRILLSDDRDIDAPFVADAGSLQKLNIYVAAASAITSFEVSGDFFTTVCGLPSTSFNFFLMNPEGKAHFAELGVSQTYTYDDENDESITKLTFGKVFLDKLEQEGEYPITFTAIDTFGRTVTKTLHLRISSAFVTTDDAERVNIYARHATITGQVVKEGAENPALQYRKLGSQTWIKAATTLSGNTLSATINGLEPGTTYQYVAVAENSNAQDVKTFTTEEALQLPNSSFEDWDLSNTAYMPQAPGAAEFWDTGNHGSTTLGPSYNITTRDTQYKHSGEYSVKMASRYIIVKFAAGNIFIGKYLETAGTNGILGFGRSFTSRPAKLHGYVRYEPGPFNRNKSAVPSQFTPGDYDEGMIYVALAKSNEMSTTYNNTKYSWNPQIIRTGGGSTEVLFDSNADHIVGYGEMPLTSATPGDGMIEFTIDIDYRSNELPAYIILTASASRYGDYFAGGDTSVMWLDDLELIYE